MRIDSTRPWMALGVAALLLAACASPKRPPAPVEERSRGGAPAASPPPVASPAPAVTAPSTPPSPGSDNAGKPGYYTVKPGDTLVRIGLENGQNWRDIARWNGLENPNRLEVGQVLRVAPPDTLAVARPVTGGTVAVAPAPTGAVSAPASAQTTASPARSEPAASNDEIVWAWPSESPVIAGFDEVKNKGLDFGGKAGDPVLAAADGRIVYAGTGLRGYGNLLIVKHNNTFLSAYAHNRALLVKEDQAVRRGQKIAEMGSTDADRVKLHFEIRRQGKPVDPAKFLPGRQ